MIDYVNANVNFGEISLKTVFVISVFFNFISTISEPVCQSVTKSPIQLPPTPWLPDGAEQKHAVLKVHNGMMIHKANGPPPPHYYYSTLDAF